MATKLEKQVKRETLGTLDGSFGKDRNKPLIAVMSVGDIIILTPKRSQRSEIVSLFDVYRFAIRCRVNKEVLEKARNNKEKKRVKSLAAKLKRDEKKLTKPLN